MRRGLWRICWTNNSFYWYPIIHSHHARSSSTLALPLPSFFSEICETASVPMHFGKTYAQLLLSLPPDLSQNAIQYRQASLSMTI